MGSPSRISNYAAAGVAQLIGMYSKPRGAIVALAPVILGITPNTGPAAGGTLVRITGYNFEGVSGVTIGGAPCTALVVGGGIITCYTPAGTGAQALAITGPAGTTTQANAFVYPNAAGIPTLSAVDFYPQADTQGGDVLVLTGTNLLGATSAAWGGIGCTIGANTSTSITLTLPSAGSPGTYNIIVTTPGGSTAGFPIEAWAPTNDPAVTLLMDSKTSPYNAVTGFWLARYSVIANTRFRNTSTATGYTANHSVLNGGPSFDGDGANEAGMYTETTSGGAVNLSDFLSTPSGGAVAGSYAAVVNSTNTQTLIGHSSVSVAPYAYSSPTIMGNMTQATCGMAFGFDGGVAKFQSHIYPTATSQYTSNVAVGSTGATHAVVSRWGNALGNSLDLCVDGQVGGAGFDTQTVDSGTSSTYNGSALYLGDIYPAANTTAQIFKGGILALCVMNAKASDTFVQKHRKWAARRFGAV